MKVFNKIKQIPNKWTFRFLFLCFIISRLTILNSGIKGSNVKSIYMNNGIISGSY